MASIKLHQTWNLWCDLLDHFTRKQAIQERKKQKPNKTNYKMLKKPWKRSRKKQDDREIRTNQLHVKEKERNERNDTKGYKYAGRWLSSLSCWKLGSSTEAGWWDRLSELLATVRAGCWPRKAFGLETCSMKPDPWVQSYIRIIHFLHILNNIAQILSNTLMCYYSFKGHNGFTFVASKIDVQRCYHLPS